MANPTAYLFNTTSANPCDLCDLMKGEHDTPPHVPVHPHCECEVEILSPADSGDDGGDDDEGDTSFYEVRNVQTNAAEYTESFVMAEFDGLPEDTTLTVKILLGLQEEHLDEPLTIDDLDIDEPSGSESEEVTVPAHASGTVEAEVLMTEYVVVAELWRVYTVTTEHVALVEEEHVEDIGGLVTFRSELAGVTVNETPNDPGHDGGDGFFEDGDEVPV